MSEKYFDRHGNLITMWQWVHLYEQGGNHVAEDWVNGVRISTVWLGLNHNFGSGGLPLIFETMVFGGPHDLDQWRWSTEVQALAGHDQIVAMVRSSLVE